MKTPRRLLLLLLMLASIIVPATTGFAADPLPGTCGLPDDTTTTFAFAGPALNTELSGASLDIMACQSATMVISYVQGCGRDYYMAHTDHGALNMSLAQAGFRAPNGASITLLDVINVAENVNGGHDSYLIQAVTAYLNSLYVEGYAYGVQEVLDGYHGSQISEGSFAWNNHGAIGQFVVPSCPLPYIDDTSN